MTGYLWVNPLLVLALAGCSVLPSHIHSPRQAARASKAEAELAEYAKNAPPMYSAMLSNLEKFKAEEDFLLTELATNYHTALVTRLPSMTWEEFKKRVTERRAAIAAFRTRLARAVSVYLVTKKVVAGQATDAKAALKAARDAVREQKARVEAWNATVAMFQDSFRSLPAIGAELRRAKGAEQLATIARDVGDRKIKFRDADGKEVTRSVREILTNHVDGLRAGQRLEQLVDAPGLALLMVNLGLDLAQVEQRRAEAMLAQLNARATLLGDGVAAMDLADALLGDVDESTKTFAAAERPFTTVVNHWQDAKTLTGDPKKRVDAERLLSTANAVALALSALRKEAVAEAIIARHEGVLTVALARLDHQDSIVESRIADEAWRALLKSGIGGLVAYHKAGFSSEDMANIIRAAQTIAVAAIAAGVH